MMRQLWDDILTRFGQDVTLRGEETVTCRAIIQPCPHRSGGQEVPGPLGRGRRDRFRYMGPAGHPLELDTAVEWKGTPFFLGRLRHRYGLWVTLGVCLTALVYGSFFIWDFQVEGNVKVSEEEILRALERHGVRFGTYGYAVDSPELRNYILLEIPELSYIAVNVKGCRAYVQVRERIPSPEIISKREPGNTVAAKDALITAIQPWDGEKQVLPGSMVTEGQLLISGVMQDHVSGVRYLRGMGKV